MACFLNVLFRFREISCRCVSCSLSIDFSSPYLKKIVGSLKTRRSYYKPPNCLGKHSKWERFLASIPGEPCFFVRSFVLFWVILFVHLALLSRIHWRAETILVHLVSQRLSHGESCFLCFDHCNCFALQNISYLRQNGFLLSVFLLSVCSIGFLWCLLKLKASYIPYLYQVIFPQISHLKWITWAGVMVQLVQCLLSMKPWVQLPAPHLTRHGGEQL